MKRLFPIIPLLMAAAPAAAQPDPVASSWGLSPAAASFDRYVYFNPGDQGRKLPIFWGFDTAWNDYANMLRGVRYCGADVVGWVGASVVGCVGAAGVSCFGCSAAGAASFVS